MQRWIIARLRKRRFFSLAEANAAIREVLDRLNGKVTRHLGASRRALFWRLDKPALKPLPSAPYAYAEWFERRVGLDYHVEVEKHYYSVPHQLLNKTLWVRVSARTVEIFHDGQRVASHVRTSGNARHTTVASHMPASHRRYAELTPAELRRRAEAIGPETEALVDLILRTQAASRAGFPGLHRDRPNSRAPWPRRARGRLPARPRDRRAVLQLGPVDPAEQPASPTAPEARGGAGDHSSQHPRRQLLPLTEESACSTIPPMPRLRALKLDGMADAFAELQAQDGAADLGQAEWLGLLIDREAANRST